MPQPTITKESFLAANVCTTRGWYLLHDQGGTPTPGEQLRMEEGKDIHRRAQSLHPNGTYAGNIANTNQLILDSSVEVIFEAAFQVDGYAARADWIRRVDCGWAIGEIKSSLHNDDGPKPEHIDDLAYTTMVLRRAGLPVQACELVLMNRAWRLGMDNPSLFITTDHKDAVIERADEFNQSWDRLGPMINRASRPSPHWCYECRNCNYFDDQCVGVGVDDPIFVLPRLSEKKFNELSKLGALSIHGVPTDYPLTANQAVVAKAIRTATPQINLEVIRDNLDQLQWPVGYLDFETVKTAIPMYPEVAPHEQIVTQYSLHIQQSKDVDPKHVDYLADHRLDCREELTQRLLTDTTECGSVVVYSPFEKTTIRGLAWKFPDLEQELQNLESKLFDLEPVIRTGLIHPQFKGRSSIKVVLPVLVPGLNYQELEIGDGDSAIAAFVDLAKGERSENEMSKIRVSLMEYCKMDTQAMALIVDAVRSWSLKSNDDD